VILAACDLGSNSHKLTVAHVGADRAIDVLYETADITRIGEGLADGGSLLPAAIDRTIATLVGYARTARGLGAEKLHCVATAGLRNATNADLFLTRAREEAGVAVEIIDGMREAALSFRGVAAAYGAGWVAVVDPGGRSTEIAAGQDGVLRDRVSLELGGVRLTERHLPHDPPLDGELDRCRDAIRATLAAHAPALPRETVLIGVSGTITALLGVQMNDEDIARVADSGEGVPLLRTSVHAAYEDMRRRPAAERIRGTIIPVGRADVIVAGAMIVEEIMAWYRVEQMLASRLGVRYGLLREAMDHG
jgi:exopolyphosphatase/guanosine-5'-triphosphate,3'-diphosphate pyrophosphatase